VDNDTASSSGCCFCLIRVLFRIRLFDLEVINIGAIGDIHAIVAGAYFTLDKSGITFKVSGKEDGDYDKIEACPGGVTLSNSPTLSNNLVDPYVPCGGETFTLISAPGGVDGTFANGGDTVTTAGPDGVDFAIDYMGSNAVNGLSTAVTITAPPGGCGTADRQTRLRPTRPSVTSMTMFLRPVPFLQRGERLRRGCAPVRAKFLELTGELSMTCDSPLP
jgi:hypothetical protein